MVENMGFDRGVKNGDKTVTYNVINKDNDPVERPKGYTQGEIEVIDFIEDQGLDMEYHLANVIKYICRCRHKENMLQDLKKARWYLDRKINNIIKDEERQAQGIIMAEKEIKELAKKNKPAMIIKKEDIIKT